MKRTFIALWLIISQWIIVYHAFAQSDNFNLTFYKRFLASHQNLTTNQILNMYPAGSFAIKVPQSQPPIYLDSIILKYNLTDYEQSLINQHGFMVSERLSHQSFGNAFLDIWHKDLPVFISTDAILHALHMSYSKILMDVEVGILIPKLTQLLTDLHSQLPFLASRYANEPSIAQMLRDVDLYLTVPRKLLDPTVSPYYIENNSTINQLLNLIRNEQPAVFPLFSSVTRTIDFSQFKTRGHYTDPYYPKLAKYFKAMMWLGRTEIYLIQPQNVYDSAIPFIDIQRQIIISVLIKEAAQLANALPLLEEIDSIIQFFVGESDNVTLPNIIVLTEACDITLASQLLDTSMVKKFQDSLKTKSFAWQRILSQILCSDITKPDSIVPASAFLLLGQRFIIDSYITGQVVFDRIKFHGTKVRRMLPKTLDVLFGLGNNAALQLLQSELNQYNYGTNLSALRYLVDSYGSDFWKSSLFNLWLNSIRQLNPPLSRDNFPPFMQTAAWWQQKMNTQLASWAQLRHDNLLYAKQSYTGGIVCSYPYGYVEPIPEFYQAIKALAEEALERFQPIQFQNSHIKTWILGYFNDLKGVSDTLKVIAHKELANIPFSNAEISFMKRILYEEPICGVEYRGWYVKLFYNDYGSGDQLLKQDLVVADIHTAPTDAEGVPIGWVLHAGTGDINLGVFVASIPGGQNIAFVGPVMSYHEYLSTNFLRLTDEEWKASYLAASSRPSFVNLYLADKTGNSRGEGINLFMSVNDKPISVPKSFILHQNYPNPFNSTTIISFSIPENLANLEVEIIVYNIHGQVVKRLLKSILPANNYMTRWDGTDEKNVSVPSGVYFYKLKVGNYLSTGKMSLVR